MTIDDQNLSELMKVIRRQLSLSQEDLARALGISFPTVNRWENSLVRSLKLTIEKENPTLKGVLPKDYSRPSLDKYRLGELIDIISKIGLGDDESRSKDILGRVCGYFLGRFAAAEDSL